MVGMLLLVGAIAVVYFLSQGVTGVEADAPGHCCSCTEENLSDNQKLSYDALVQLAQDAGFDTDSNTAAAIALAESSGDPNAYNPEKNAHLGPGYHDAPDGKGSFGLWQIYSNAHPEFDGQDLTDPQTNANAAYSIYAAAGGFSPWSTFKSGAYQRYMA
jgi:soluble lytic murein transglycosylase-like protein